MTTLAPYLFFQGNCRKAMEFYKECFGGSLEIMTYKDAPQEACAQLKNESDKSKVMHASLMKDNFVLFASDDVLGVCDYGNNMQICINCNTADEVDQLFSKLGKDGKSVMTPDNTFWGARFGVVADQFGIQWMLNCQLNKGEKYV